MTVTPCTEDPDLWFAERKADRKRAAALCHGCPLRESCLQHALDTGEKFGVWGGLDERDRHRLLHPPAPRPPRGAPAPQSEVVGVVWNAPRAKWSASVRNDGEYHWLGRFTDRERAERAVLRKYKELGMRPVYKEETA